MTPLALNAVPHNQFLTMSLPADRATDAHADAAKAAEEFEANYLSTVFDRMFSSIKTDGPYGGGNAEATWRSFLANEYAGEVARNGGIGLADSVKAELIGLQEISPK